MSNEHRYPEIDLLLQILEEAYSKKAWHGPNLKGSIRGLTAKAAEWRPASKRHNIWEIVVHAAYWKYAVRRMLRGDPKGTFALKGSNWFPSPASITVKAWSDAVALLETEHGILTAAIRELDPPALQKKPVGSKYPFATLIYGIASHDIYHAGQIQLLKRLQVMR